MLVGVSYSIASFNHLEILIRDLVECTMGGSSLQDREHSQLATKGYVLTCDIQLRVARSDTVPN